MTAKVVKLKLVKGVGNGAKVAANKVLSGARSKLADVVVVGSTHDGDPYAASSGGPGDAVPTIEFIDIGDYWGWP